MLLERRIDRGACVRLSHRQHGLRERAIGDLSAGKYGRLVPVGGVGAIAQAIIETLGESVGPKILRARAAQFSSETIAGEYERLLPGVSNGSFIRGSDRRIAMSHLRLTLLHIVRVT